MKRACILLAAALIPIGELHAQAEAPRPDESSVASAYRRTPALRNDPFRHVMVPHWGVVFSFGASAENNALLVSDLSNFVVNNRDDELITNVVTTLGAVPPGTSLRGNGQGEGGIYFGGPIHRHLSIGFSAQARGYGSFRADEDAVVLLRDGVGGQTEFSLGNTGGSAIATTEYGVHAMFRMNPLGPEGGLLVSMGVGGRYIRPIGYGTGQSFIDSRLAVIGDSIAGLVQLDQALTADAGLSQAGSGFAGDFLVRAEWPVSGFALEAMVANVGNVTVGGLERRTLSFSVATTNLAEVNDSLEAATYQVQDTVDASVNLPRIVRFGASAWASRYLQLDGSATLPVNGEFEMPLVVDVGSTWRLDPSVPIRLGLVLGGHHGIGYTAGLGVESRHFLFGVSGGSLGGLFQDATGFAGRFDLGMFF
jgi:hypothetical protein